MVFASEKDTIALTVLLKMHFKQQESFSHFVFVVKGIASGIAQGVSWLLIHSFFCDDTTLLLWDFFFAAAYEAKVS